MRKLSHIIGICLLSAGIGILVANFLPDSFLVSIQAILLVISGLLIIF